MSIFIISLDFELFWGVADSHTMANYRANVEGEWEVVPRMLELFRRYDIHATWAVVGMAMCRGFAQWRAMRPSVLPAYDNPIFSNYRLDQAARRYPRLFFARPLVERILQTPGQELATHTHSHFYCGEAGATPRQFAADLECAVAMALDMGTRYRSIVFPRNQIDPRFLAMLKPAGIDVFRGNPRSWLYRDGHTAPGGLAGRALRWADSWLPLSGQRVSQAQCVEDLIDVPASLFLRPWSARMASLEVLRLCRLKEAMTAAARCGGLCHLWWHPHNFGVNREQNLAVLESLLRHYVVLRDRYGMRSAGMAEVAEWVDAKRSVVATHLCAGKHTAVGELVIPNER